MGTQVLDGVSFADADWVNRGHLNSVTVAGVAYPRWQALWVAGLNEVSAQIATTGESLSATSTTTETIGAGAKSLTIETGKGFSDGNVVIAVDAANSTNWMIGTVSAYDTGTGALGLTVAPGDTSGSGSISNWQVSLTGKRGETGAISGAADGSVTTPGISWSSDSDTGFYRDGDGAIAVASNGTRIAAFGSAGLAMNGQPVTGDTNLHLQLSGIMGW